MPDRVGAGWRHGIRWSVVGVFRPRDGFYHYEFQIDRKAKGAYRS